MIIHDIPDIRLFWSKDSGFLNQFDDSKLDDNIKYKAVSQFPQCTNDLSFWLPAEIKIENFSSNDFYEIVREVGGDIVEHVSNILLINFKCFIHGFIITKLNLQVSLIDQFTHPKSGKQSLCYRIVYRHMERTLRQNEVNAIHEDIAKMLVNKCNVVLR